MNNLNKAIPQSRVFVRTLTGGLGDGAGRGGGSGGSIRSAGGVFGKMEAAREDEFFYKQQNDQLKALHDQVTQELEHHKEQMEKHKKVIDRHSERLRDLEKELKIVE